MQTRYPLVSMNFPMTRDKTYRDPYLASGHILYGQRSVWRDDGEGAEVTLWTPSWVPYYMFGEQKGVITGVLGGLGVVLVNPPPPSPTRSVSFMSSTKHLDHGLWLRLIRSIRSHILVHQKGA